VAIILEVNVNGETFAIAGEESLSVLSAHITAAGKLGDLSHGTRDTPDSRGDITVSVGGLTNRGKGVRDEHLNWGPRRKLSVGDIVTIRVREGAEFDLPSHRSPTQDYPGSSLSARKRFIDAKSLYFRLRGKYGAHARKLEKQWLRRHYFTLR
jgi:hypothetical protein